MTQPGESDSRVWVNPETGGVESTMEWQRRLNAGDPEAHRQLAELASTPARQLAREVIANLIKSSQAPPDITAKAIMQALERQNLAIFAREGEG